MSQAINIQIINESRRISRAAVDQGNRSPRRPREDQLSMIPGLETVFCRISGRLVVWLSFISYLGVTEPIMELHQKFPDKLPNSAAAAAIHNHVFYLMTG